MDNVHLDAQLEKMVIDALHEQDLETSTADLATQLAAVCRRIPPLWELENYVAVNPFLAFAGQPLPAAAQLIGDGIGARVLPDLSFYQERWRAGAFASHDLDSAAYGASCDSATLAAILDGRRAMPQRHAEVLRSFAERYDASHATQWDDRLCRQASLWCALHVPQGAARWGAPQGDGTLWGAWRSAASFDRSLEVAGLGGWRAWVAALPPTPLMTIGLLLDRLGVPEPQRQAYCYRLLGGVYGWASLLRRDAWQHGDAEPLAVIELLAIRMCYDAAAGLLLPPVAGPATVSCRFDDERLLTVLQTALEGGYARRLAGAIAPLPSRVVAARPAVQAVFCIDVRSEPFRRQLEAQDEAIETLGFAGFFGLTMAWDANGSASARCPVLLAPALQVASLAQEAERSGRLLLKDLPGAPPAALTFVETIGLGYGIGLLRDALALKPAPASREWSDPFAIAADTAPLAVAARTDQAIAIVKNMGLRGRVATIVLLCGHESQSANNPHAAGLDCGACGGHGGAINARVAAALLNDAAVRAEMALRGWALPEDTWFVPAIHTTSLDTVALLDTENIPPSHRAELARLDAWLARAGAACRQERSAALGLAQRPPNVLDRLLRRRARDWSEVRPEWALARNASFIAARRERSRPANLDGRAFLHEYDWTTDPDLSILSLILNAPMVVASWINLQYFASTVDNDLFGCGTKTLHNLVGRSGVVLGNGGDLRTGLALQSVSSADGRWFHEPLRLQVFVEAPQQRIDAVLDASPGVADLVENGWIRLFAIDPEREAVAQRTAGGWEPIALAI